MTFQIKFFNKNRVNYDNFEFSVGEDDDLLEALEDHLYILQELTPVHPNWKKDLALCDSCLFTYLHVEHVMVVANEIGSTTFKVYDI